MKITRKRGITIILLVLSLLVLSDVWLWSSGKVGVFNTAKRVLSGAPQVTLNGQTLSYQGKVDFEGMDTLEEYATSDAGIPLYKALHTPPSPPWIYVQHEHTIFFRYNIPKAPWKM
ncbi:hypothetical protein [Paenibacillus sp. MER 99-2]|uniref:hypothetical protein n=1 Tax=Paenibacillus sp. MER 99-2 TaxID=2939572 RepID=UPI00203C87EE|nr:hypothetical protein [Paenibacillus sp. MER 99-2]MCM3170753.1 hypothetical protein [Paenibacillus sp. MER 99-2]